MKKFLGLLLMFTLVLSLASCGEKDEKTKIMDKYETLTSTDHVFDQVTLDELDDVVATGEKTFVYFGSPICHACVATIGHLDKMAKELGIETIYYVDFEYTSDLSGEWYETGKYDYKGTPAVVVFEDGEFMKSYQSDEYADGPDLVAKMYMFLSDYA